MAANDDEEELLRSVALQNAQSILLARQQAEEALRKQSEWLRITLASIGDAVISTDAEGRVTFMNGVAEALTGWTQAEAVGPPSAGRLPASSTNRPAGRSRTPPSAPCGRGRSWGWRTTPSSSPGTARSGRSTTAPPRCGTSRGPVGAVLVFRDVTERKRAEDSPGAGSGGHRRVVRRTRSSARRSTASSARGTPGRSGCSATRPTRPWAGRSP